MDQSFGILLIFLPIKHENVTVGSDVMVQALDATVSFDYRKGYSYPYLKNLQFFHAST
jgi:hypothetical protein